MPAITRDQAVQRISTEIGKFACDDLVEVHNELFPDAPRTMGGGGIDSEELSQGIMDRIRNGLETEEIVDLWNVVFPKDHNVWYDDETETVRFNEEPEQVESAE